MNAKGMDAKNEFLSEIVKSGEEFLALLRETSGLVAYYRRLLERYELDTLTGLPGSNKFRDHINELKDSGFNIGVIFFDVNNLKYYNDTKGHYAGDLLLQKASESIHLSCGINTTAYRVGGDEFVVIITNCEESAIESFISTWLTNLEKLNQRDDGVNCSVAVGAAFGSGEYKLGDILKLADERMYQDKRRTKEHNEGINN